MALISGSYLEGDFHIQVNGFQKGAIAKIYGRNEQY
jgi:hypothetical protein